ncbi:argininosuccinate synthase [Drosophila yakuba]|uniref:argininosuccinate synthase n=1 Tax=Drosophila yakuba TaxID=7245 RepID=UPI0019307C45|nr:argininosuccinate synthase [Drosophila yakuba]
MADYVYNGFWFSPEATYDRKCIKLAEQRVSGKVTVELAPGYCRGVSMNVHGGYVPQDAVRVKAEAEKTNNFSWNGG